MVHTMLPQRVSAFPSNIGLCDWVSLRREDGLDVFQVCAARVDRFGLLCNVAQARVLRASGIVID